MPKLSSPAAIFFVIVGSAIALSDHADVPVRCAFAAGVAAVIAAWLLAHALVDAAHEHAAARVAVAKYQTRAATPREPTMDEIVDAVAILQERERCAPADVVPRAGLTV